MSYRTLCAAVERTAGTIKLGHGSEGWMVQVILRPTADDPAHRAVGAIFPDIDELDAQSVHLLEWVRASRHTTEEVR